MPYVPCSPLVYLLIGLFKEIYEVSYDEFFAKIAFPLCSTWVPLANWWSNAELSFE